MSADKLRRIALIIPLCLTGLLKLGMGVSLSLALALLALLIRLWALKADGEVYLEEVRSFPYLALGSLLALILGGAGQGYYLAFGLATLMGFLVAGPYKLPLFILVQSLIFRAQAIEVTRGMDIFISFSYGLIMIFSALGLMERRKKYRRKGK